MAAGYQWVREDECDDCADDLFCVASVYEPALSGRLRPRNEVLTLSKRTYSETLGSQFRRRRLP
jgi:hypothetical protein